MIKETAYEVLGLGAVERVADQCSDDAVALDDRHLTAEQRQHERVPHCNSHIHEKCIRMKIGVVPSPPVPSTTEMSERGTLNAYLTDRRRGERGEYDVLRVM